MTSRFQKLALLAHITSSVGWFGAVVPYLALAIAALTSHDEQMVRAACLSMKLIGWYVIVPFSLAALLSGLIQSLGTRWGVFRQWWIVAKFILTVFAIVVLWQHMRDVGRLAVIAKAGTPSTAVLRPELIHSAGGLLVLFAAMVLSVFKPWGMTPYGRRRASQPDSAPHPINVPVAAHEPIAVAMKLNWRKIVAYHAIGLAVLFAIVHTAVFHMAGMHH